MASLPLEDAERIESGNRGADRPGVLAVLVGGEGANAEALVGTHLGGEVVARIGAGERHVAVVVVHVGAVGTHADRKGGDAGGKLQERHRLSGEVQQVRSAARNAGEDSRIGEGEDDVAVGVGEVERIALQLEIDDARDVAAVSPGPRGCFVRDEGAGAVDEGAVDLLDGAKQAVSNGGSLRGLRRADQESGSAGGADRHRNRCRQAVGRRGQLPQGQQGTRDEEWELFRVHGGMFKSSDSRCRGVAAELRASPIPSIQTRKGPAMSSELLSSPIWGTSRTWRAWAPRSLES